MARNDGVDRTVVRNNAYRRNGIELRERHNERKNESYSNPDIVPERSALNIHFKSPGCRNMKKRKKNFNGNYTRNGKFLFWGNFYYL